MNYAKTMLFVSTLVACGALHAIDTQSTPEPGKWCDDIDACVEYAELHAMPILAAWGHDGCGNCRTLTNNLESAEFKTWADARKILMCFGWGETDKAKKIRRFCDDGPNNLRVYPFVSVYWPRPGQRTVYQNFTGTRSNMPVNTESTFAGCLIASVEKYIKGYEYMDPTKGPVSFSAVDKSVLLAANGYLFAKRTMTVPLIVKEGDVSRLDGLLTVNQAANNRLTVKYTGASSSRTLSFNGTWVTVDLRNGEVAGTFEKDGSELALAMSSEGTVTATLSPLLPFFDGKLEGVSATTSAGGCDGTFTALLKPATGAAGIGYASLSLRGAKATVKGVLSDGTALTGSFPVLASGDGVIIPIFKRTTKLLFGAVVSVQPAKEGSGFSVEQAVTAYTCDPLGEQMTDYVLSGTLADAKMGPAELFAKYGLDTDCVLSADVSAIRGSDYGTPAAIAPVELEAGPSKFVMPVKGPSLKSVSYAASTATFGGKLTLTFDQGKALSAVIKGAMVPALAAKTGVIGCGTAYFKDRVGGATVTRSLPVTIRTNADK